jgi:hypothetical protein
MNASGVCEVGNVRAVVHEEMGARWPGQFGERLRGFEHRSRSSRFVAILQLAHTSVDELFG